MEPNSTSRDGGQRGAHFIHLMEQAVYFAIGGMLVLTLLLALAGAGKILWEGLQDWAGTGAIFQLIDRLLFVLMLVEILNTVQASIRTRTLVCEPFLIVGMIACIRRILVITLETSQITKPTHWPAEQMQIFYASMIELAVLGGLVIILIVSIYVTRIAMRVQSEENKPQ
jgi:uncharacterized membrane protein (DUF373 family)